MTNIFARLSLKRRSLKRDKKNGLQQICIANDVRPSTSVSREVPSSERKRTKLRRFILELVEKRTKNVSPIPESEDEIDPAKIRFHIAELRTELERFSAVAERFTNARAAIGDLLTYKYPLVSAICLLVWFYSIWRGLFIALFLSIALIQLSINYLSEVQGIDLGLSLLPRKLAERRKKKKKRVVEPEFDLEVFITEWARWLSDLLEKLESLFTWKKPFLTLCFFGFVGYLMIAAAVLPSALFMGLLGFAIGGRLFFLEFLFDRFPRLRYRLDPIGYLYYHLPLADGEVPQRPPPFTAETFPSYQFAAKLAATQDSNAPWTWRSTLDYLWTF